MTNEGKTYVWGVFVPADISSPLQFVRLSKESEDKFWKDVEEILPGAVQGWYPARLAGEKPSDVEAAALTNESNRPNARATLVHSLLSKTFDSIQSDAIYVTVISGKALLKDNFPFADSALPPIFESWFGKIDSFNVSVNKEKKTEERIRRNEENIVGYYADRAEHTEGNTIGYHADRAEYIEGPEPNPYHGTHSEE